MDLSFSVGIKIVFMVIVAPINLVVSTQSLDTGRHAMLRARADMLVCECCSHRQKKASVDESATPADGTPLPIRIR